MCLDVNILLSSVTFGSNLQSLPWRLTVTEASLVYIGSSRLVTKATYVDSQNKNPEFLLIEWVKLPSSSLRFILSR